MLTATFLSLVTFIVAVGAIVAVVAVVGIGIRWPGRLFQILMLLTVGASVGTILLTVRVLTFDARGLSLGAEADGGGGLLGRTLLIGVIGCAVSACIGWFVAGRHRRLRMSQFDAKSKTPPNDIVLAFLVYFIAFSVFPLPFAPTWDFHVSLIYPFFLFLALLLWVQVSTVDTAIVAKQCLGIIVFGSLVAAIFLPSTATQPGYVGLLPGFNTRLWGVTASANSLGSVACVLLVLEVAEPSRRRWLRLAILAAAATALLMSQSKTSIVAGAVGVAIIYSWRLAEASFATSSHRNRQGLPMSVVGIGSTAILICIVGAWLMFSDYNILAAMERRLETRAVGDLSTATGRTLIWRVAIDGGLASPLFGQGLAFWSLESRLQTGLTGAVHAHNMFLQVFSRSGFIGLAAFLVFFFLLVTYSVRAAKATRGGSIGLLVVFLMRAMVEVPIQPNSILGAEFFAMAGYLFYVMDRGAKPVGNLRKAITVLPLGHVGGQAASHLGVQR